MLWAYKNLSLLNFRSQMLVTIIITMSKLQYHDGGLPRNVELLPQTPYLLGCMTQLRNRTTTDISHFGCIVNQVARQLVQQGKLSAT